MTAEVCKAVFDGFGRIQQAARSYGEKSVSYDVIFTNNLGTFIAASMGPQETIHLDLNDNTTVQKVRDFVDYVIGECQDNKERHRQARIARLRAQIAALEAGREEED